MYTSMKSDVILEKEGAKMIQEGLRADQIARKIYADEMDVRRWAKKHRLGKRLDENEGCTTRQATPEELAGTEGTLPEGASPQKAKPARQERTAPPPKVAGEMEKTQAYLIVMKDVIEQSRHLHTLETFIQKQLENMAKRDEGGRKDG